MCIASAGHGDFLGSDVGWGKHFNSKYKSSHDAVILGRPKEHDSRTNCKLIMMWLYNYLWFRCWTCGVYGVFGVYYLWTQKKEEG